MEVKIRTEQRLHKLGFQLPPTPEPAAAYVPAVWAGELIYVSGQTPKDGNTLLYKGKVGQDLSVDEGSKAAQICILRCLSAVKSLIGDLDLIGEIVKVIGYVNCAEDFTQHSQVLHGASNLLLDVFQTSGQHAQSAIGVNSLPGNAALEVELIVKIVENNQHKS